VFPVFNVADTAVTCATILWIVRHWVLLSAGQDAQSET